MKVILDASKCELHGECVMAAPLVFDIEDDMDSVTVLDSEPGDDQRSAVENAVMMCPTSAIRLED